MKRVLGAVAVLALAAVALAIGPGVPLPASYTPPSGDPMCTEVTFVGTPPEHVHFWASEGPPKTIQNLETNETFTWDAELGLYQSTPPGHTWKFDSTGQAQEIVWPAPPLIPIPKNGHYGWAP